MKTRSYWCVSLSQAKKEAFLPGEVFFVLTCPLMGDALIYLISLSSHYNIKKIKIFS
jgi:hypothetical protein